MGDAVSDALRVVPKDDNDFGWTSPLDRVGTALTSPLDFGDALRVLASLARDAIGADRSAIFILEGRQLYPAMAVGPDADADLWKTFQAMGPMDLDPLSWSVLAEGQPVAIEDARTSGFIPPVWVETFGLRGVALAGLHAGGRPCGILTVDYRQPRTFSPAELARLASFATHVGTAVASARPFEVVRRRARLQEALARGAAALASPLEPDRILRRLVRAYCELLGARVCAIALFDSERGEMSTLASRNTRTLRGPIPLAEIPLRIVTPLWESWTSQNPHALEMRDEPWLDDYLDAGSADVALYLLVPLVVQGKAKGGVALGFGAGTELDPEEKAAAEALAAIAAAALERHELLELLERQLRQLRALYAVSTALTERSDAAALLNGLNEILRDHGVEAVTVTFRDRALAKHLGGEAPTAAERALFRSGDSVELPDDILAVPLRLGRQVLGTLRVRPASLGAEDRDFVQALASGLADVARRGALRAAVEEGERDRAVAFERDRLASDLHDTVGQLFVAVGLLARRLAEELPPASPWAAQAERISELTEQAKGQVERAIRAQAFAPAIRRGLVSSLRALARALTADSGVRMEVSVKGRPARLSPDAERAFYRVAHEALTNAWRHARCSRVQIELAYSTDEIRLCVSDDGIGMPQSEPRDGLHTGITSMRRTMAEVQGDLRITAATPQGTVVEARMGREPR
jgi:signal transduction histidine kinase